MGSAETANMRTLIIFFLFSFLIAVIGASSSNSTKAGTTKQLLTISDNQNLLKTKIFTELFDYALVCCRTYYDTGNNCKDNSRTQMAYFVYLPKVRTDGTEVTVADWPQIKILLDGTFNPSKMDDDTKRKRCGKGSDVGRFFAIDTTTEHTERTLLPIIEMLGRDQMSPVTDAKNFYLFTVKSPCTRSTNYQSCTDAIFYTEYMILSQKWSSSTKFHSLHVGFREWFVFKVNGVYIPDKLGRDYFCLGQGANGLGVDGNKWERESVSDRYDYESKLSFTKFRLQNDDEKFNPGTTPDGREHC